jgi:hypothetical protein
MVVSRSALRRFRVRQIPILAVIALAMVLTPAPVAARASKPHVALDVSRRGSYATHAVRVPTRWELRWSFSCLGAITTPNIVNFTLEVVSPHLFKTVVSRKGGAGAGVLHLRGSGKTSLQMTSICRWHVLIFW